MKVEPGAFVYKYSHFFCVPPQLKYIEVNFQKKWSTPFLTIKLHYVVVLCGLK